MDDKNVQEMNALEEAAFNDPVKFLNEQHAPRTWTLSTVDLAKTAAVSPYEIMATSEERWGPEKASIASTAIREFARGFMGIAETSVNGSLEDRAKEIIYRSPNMRQKDANRLIEDVMRSGSLARQVENYEASKTAHDNFTAGISNGLGSMVSLALLGWASKSPALVGVAAGLGEAYSAREEMVDRYIQDMGTAEGLAGQLGKYNALATGYGAFAGFVEGSIGVERLAAGALNRYGRLAAMERLARQQGKFGKALAYKTGRQVVATGLEEGGEEFLQSIGQDVAVALTRDMWENPDVKKALIQAGYGALIGSTSGGIMYNIGRKRAIDFIRRWNDENNAGLTESQIVQAADAALDDVAQPMVDEIATRAELRNQYGQAYEILKNRFRQQIESTGTTPWTDQNKSMEEYIETLASTLSIPAVLQANGLNIPTAQFLEIADMVVQDNVLQFVPLNNAAELEDIIARQTSILAQQREAKKLGMGDDTVRQTAEQRRAVAQKALRNLREEERIRKQIVQEKRKADKKRLGYDEIDQAKKDTKFLKNARTLDSFKAKLEDGTTTEQAKNRLEAAFMNWIADKDKTLAEDLILYRGGMQKAVDLLTANAKVIYDTAKKHPGAGLREDIANALRKLRHTNKDNFLLVTQALARDGHDVMPENILLWNWLFADPATNNQFLTNYATKLVENREQIADGQALFGQKVAPLSKKDLIMQALQDTDQAKAQLAESRGRKYEPLFDQNGAVKEPYLAAAIVSYQNQFAPRFNQQMSRLFQEQFDLANENARLDEMYPEYTGDTIEVDGKVRTVYNSEGERINKSAEALTNFWRWFGDSKVVDEQGRPLVVYHGTSSNFDTFSIDESGKNTGTAIYGQGFYFTTDKEVATKWGAKRGEPIVMGVYVKLENPNMVKELEYPKDSKEKGFDGVIAKVWGGNELEIVAFEPNQIKSVNNLGYYNAQDPRMLYQIGYASMRGEMIGDFIDANLWAHTGEGPNVHGWGNYFLADFKIDKKRYHEKFDREGPALKYDGKEVDDLVLHSVGIFHPDIKRLIKDKLGDLSVTKKMIVDTVNRQVKRDSDVYQLNIDTVIDRVKDTVGEERARKIIADMEKMLTKKGGPFMSLLSPFSPVAYPEIAKIQKKYLKKGSLTQFVDDYVTVYNELVSTFGGDRVPETSYASWFAHQFSSLNELKQSAEAVKKLDFDKFTGRTGFLYKSEDFYDWLEGKIRKSEARHIAWVADVHRYDIRQKVYNAVRDAFVHNTTIDEQINKIEDKYITPWLEIKPQLKSVIEQNIEKEKSRFPGADAKAVKKFLFDFIDKPDLEKWPSDGMVYQDWWKDDSTQADRDLIDAVTGTEDHGIESPKGEPDMIIGLMNDVREANAQKRIFDAAKNALKNVKKEDFVFKPRASMYKTDKIPENPELIDFGKRLNKQPKKIQEGIRKLIADNQENIPWLAEMSDVGFADNTTEIFPEYAINDLFDLGIDPASHVSPKILSITDMMKSDRYAGKPEEVKKRMIGLATDATVVAMLKHPGGQVTIEDIAKQIDILKEQGDLLGYEKLSFMVYEKQAINKDFDKLADFLKKGLFAYGRKGTDAANTISTWFDVSRVELKAIDGFNFFRRLEMWLNAHPEVIEKYYKPDASLGLTKNADAFEITAKLLLKYGIRGIRYWGGTDKRGFVTFEPTPVTERLFSLDFQRPEPLVATHAISKEGMERALEVGGFAMPSLAITKDIDANTYGDIVFVAPANMAQPSRDTRVYDRDAWTPMIDFIEYTAKEGFADRVKDILPPGADWSMFVSNIEEKADTWPENNTMAKQLFAIYKGFPEEEVPFVQRKFDEDESLRKEYLDWYQSFIMPNMQGRIFRGFTPKLGERSYAPVTLDNIMKGLKKQPERRDFSNYDLVGFTDVARELVTKFKSAEDIKKEQGRIQDMSAVHDQVDDLHREYNMVAMDLRINEDNHYPEFALSAALLDDAGTLAERLEKFELKNDPESIKAVEGIIKKIKKMPVRYFEVKPQRAIRFNEFSAVFVPKKDSYNEIAERLAEQGANVLRYGSNEERAAMFDELVNSDDTILFQGRRAKVRAVYDPELLTVILGKDWNELSLVHEFHHHYLKKIWDYFKQAQAGMRTVSKAWLDDTQRLFNMLEIDPNQGTLTTVQQEKFAYMVEAYLTGLGVENQDNLAFQGFLHWIPEKYRSIMDLGYLDANGQIQNPMLDEESIAFFNKWFASPLVPSLPSAPDAQRIMNASDEDGEILPSNQKVMNNREKEWGQDSEIQNKADAQLWRGIGENTPSDMRAALDGEKELMKVETNNMPDDRMLPTPPKQTLREKWFKTRQPDARELAAEAARKYVAANPDRARELAFADPETMVSYDAPVDHGMLIRAVMETVGKGSDEWYILDNNLATVKSMSGSTLALSGDLSHQAYLDAKREIESARELKAIVNYAGTGRGATEKWNGDIRAFAAKRTAAILATEPNSEERKVAIKAFLEEAKTKFSGNTTNAVLNQLDLTGYQTKDRQVFVKWAEKQIKSVSHARLDAKEQAELMKASVAAQLALRDIDSKDLKDGQYVRAVQSAKDIRHWQFVKDKMKKAYIGRWGKFGIFWDNLLGSYAPSAMLMSANTLFFANVPSTAINTATIRLAALSIGDNKVDSKVKKGEIKRIKQIFNASGVNIAQMDKPTSPSTLHGEKYTNQEQKHWYNFTFDILGREDNVFRVPTFVDALARIATKNANGDAKKATALFNEYTKLNTTDEDAKIARKQALAVANMAVFTQDGIMASALNHIRSALNTMTRGALGLEPGGFGLGNILAPFLKTGANITEMGLSATLALPRTAIAIAQNKLLGKEIPDIRRLTLISDWINLAWMSVVLALLAAIDSDDDDWYTEPYESGKRYDPNKPYDSVNFGGVWVKLDIFGPMAIPLRTALKVVKEWEKKKLAAVADGLMFGGVEALSDTPLVNQVTDSSLDYMARQPESYWTGFGYNQLNKLVPAQIKTAVRAGSRATGTTVDVGWAGKTLERKFHRNYGLDGERLTTNDIISIFTNRLKYKPQ